MTTQHLQTRIAGTTEAEHMQSVGGDRLHCCATFVPGRIPAGVCSIGATGSGTAGRARAHRSSSEVHAAELLARAFGNCPRGVCSGPHSLADQQDNEWRLPRAPNHLDCEYRMALGGIAKTASPCMRTPKSACSAARSAARRHWPAGPWGRRGRGARRQRSTDWPVQRTSGCRKRMGAGAGGGPPAAAPRGWAPWPTVRPGTSTWPDPRALGQTDSN